MVVPSVGAVVLVLFPFSDLSQAKVRPAVCLADAGRGDWVLCQVTSQAFSDDLAVPLGLADFASGGLLVPSYARPNKLFTANVRILVRAVGGLNPATTTRLLVAVTSLFQPRARP